MKEKTPFRHLYVWFSWRMPVLNSKSFYVTQSLAMRFSEHFRVKQRKTDRWFDPLLNLDTNMFIDPFLIYAKEERPFQGAHAEIISFFDYCFKLAEKIRRWPAEYTVMVVL